MRRCLTEEEDLLLGGYDPLYPDRREPWIKCHDGSLLTRQEALRQIEAERQQISNERQRRGPAAW
jgi:hypothetical protein